MLKFLIRCFVWLEIVDIVLLYSGKMLILDLVFPFAFIEKTLQADTCFFMYISDIAILYSVCYNFSFNFIDLIIFWVHFLFVPKYIVVYLLIVNFLGTIKIYSPFKLIFLHCVCVDKTHYSVVIPIICNRILNR